MKEILPTEIILPFSNQRILPVRKITLLHVKDQGSKQTTSNPNQKLGTVCQLRQKYFNYLCFQVSLNPVPFL